jgi:hypothetical protein
MAAAPGTHRRPTIGGKHTVAAKHTHKPRENRGSARERGYDARWDTFRAGFVRDHPLCEYCLADGRVEPTTVCDHDLPHEGDADLFWINTFTGLCAKHHNSDKARAEARYRGEDLLRWVEWRKTPKATRGTLQGRGWVKV